MKTFFLLFLIFPSALLACKITTLDGEDKTEEFLTVDPDTGNPFVDCDGPSKCRDLVIDDCPQVKCVQNEACTKTAINNVLESVLCEGPHSCHRTNITFANANGKIQGVGCLGFEACDVARISGPTLEQVECRGPKSCRKVHIEDAQFVMCHEGHENSLACDGFATIEAGCLFCGKMGCEEHVNTCRYKIRTQDGFESDKYLKCKPEQLIGNCPHDMEEDLQTELHGVVEIDLHKEDGDRTRGLRH